MHHITGNIVIDTEDEVVKKAFNIIKAKNEIIN